MKKQKNREKKNRKIGKKRKRLLWLENIYIWLKQVTLLNAKTSHKKCPRQRNERINIFFSFKTKHQKNANSKSKHPIIGSDCLKNHRIKAHRKSVCSEKRASKANSLNEKIIINTNGPNSAKLSKAKSQRE